MVLLDCGLKFSALHVGVLPEIKNFNILLNQIIKKTEVKKMAKKGEKYRCEKCGIVVTVDRECGCTVCDLICCGVPMKKSK